MREVDSASNLGSTAGQDHPSAKKGFTILEVTIFLAITGLLLVGVLGGTYSTIARQRYNDSVRSFAEFFRQLYAEVISPETLGSGSSNNSAIYGKIAVFGLDTPDEGDLNDEDNNVYTATLIGDVEIPKAADSFVDELRSVGARLFCGNNSIADSTDSTVSRYTPLWGTKIRTTDNKTFRGTVIIARSPASGLVHTAYIPYDASKAKFNLSEACTPDDNSASDAFYNYLQNSLNPVSYREDLDFCLVSERESVIRDVRISADGRNTSAVTITEEDDSKCHR